MYRQTIILLKLCRLSAHTRAVDVTCFRFHSQQHKLYKFENRTNYCNSLRGMLTLSSAYSVLSPLRIVLLQAVQSSLHMVYMPEKHHCQSYVLFSHCYTMPSHTLAVRHKREHDVLVLIMFFNDNNKRCLHTYLT